MIPVLIMMPWTSFTMTLTLCIRMTGKPLTFLSAYHGDRSSPRTPRTRRQLREANIATSHRKKRGYPRPSENFQIQGKGAFWSYQVKLVKFSLLLYY